jgi:hypothetical protein
MSEYAEVEENKQTDQTAKQTAVRPSLFWDSEELLLAHMQRGLTEIQTEKY